MDQPSLQNRVCGKSTCPQKDMVSKKKKKKIIDIIIRLLFFSVGNMLFTIYIFFNANKRVSECTSEVTKLNVFRKQVLHNTKSL